MRKLLAFFARPLVWSTATLLLLLLALHIVCPLLDVADEQRWVIELLIGIPLSVLLFGYHLRQFLLDRRLSTEMAAQAKKQAASAGPDALRDFKAFSEEFARGFSELNQVCRERGQVGGASALPWIMILGPSGVGKSTALERSGLRFVSHGKRLQGIGGTRNCTWWLASDAVFLDTAGRYAVRDEDRQEWRAFLQLLRKRRSRPLDAVLLQVGIDEILDRPRAEVERVALQLRERLDELLLFLDAQVPVHLLLNKCDLIDGFVPFFAALDPQEKAGPWGFRLDTEDLPKSSLGEAFQQHFSLLLQHLGQRTTTRVLTLTDREQKEAALQFPAELAATTNTLRFFVETLFEVRARSQSPWLCAFHLGSAEQTGQRIISQKQRRADELGLPGARPLGMAAMGAQASESMFLRGVFAQVLRQAELSARPSVARQKRLGFQQKLAVAVGGFFCLLGSMFLGGRYSRAVLWLSQLETTSQALAEKEKTTTPVAGHNARADIETELRAQESLRILLTEAPRGVPLLPSELATRLLRRRIEESWLLPLSKQFSSDLARAADHQSGTPDEAVARGFHVLRLLYVINGNTCPATDPETTRDSLSQVVLEHWTRALGEDGKFLRPSADSDDEQRPQTPYLQLRRELAFYFDEQPAALRQSSQLRSRVDDTLREQAKQALSRDADGAGSAALVFTLRASLANLYERDKQFSDKSLLSDPGIQRVYTRAGCAQFFSKESTQGSEWWSCIVGKELPKNPSGLGEVYRQNYTAAWNAWLQDITYSKAGQASGGGAKSALDDVVRRLDAMFRSPPPALSETIRLAGHGQTPQARLGVRKPGQSSFFAGCGKTVNQAVEKTKATWDDVKLPGACQESLDVLVPLSQLASREKPAENPDSGEGSLAADYKAYQEAAKALRGELFRISKITERGPDSLKLVQDTMGGKGPLWQLRTARDTLLQDLNGQLRPRGISVEDNRGLGLVLQDLEQRAWQALLPSAAKALQDKWRKEVLIDWQNVNKGLLQTDPDEDKCKKKTDFLRDKLKPFVEKSLAMLFEGDFLPDCHPKQMAQPFADLLPLSLDACVSIRNALKIGQEITDCPKAMGGGGAAPKREVQDVDVPKPATPTKNGCTTEADMVILDRADKVFECSVSRGICTESKSIKTTQRARLQVRWKGDPNYTVVLENDYVEPFFQHAHHERGKLVFPVPKSKAPGLCDGYRIVFGLAPAPAGGGGGAVPKAADIRWKNVNLPDSIVQSARKDN